MSNICLTYLYRDAGNNKISAASFLKTVINTFWKHCGQRFNETWSMAYILMLICGAYQLCTLRNIILNSLVLVFLD